MAMVGSVVSAALCLGGALFFVAGTIGLLRFPDVYARLHALTKADNLGLGMIATGVAIQAPSWIVALKIMLVWGFVLVASATACNLISGAARQQKIPPIQGGRG